MNETIVSLLIWLVILAPIGIFIRQIKQVRSGAQRRVKGTLLFFAYSIVPALVYIAVFASLVGIEEFMNVPLVSEGLAMTFFLVAGIALVEVLLLTCLFALTVCCFRQVNNAASPPTD
jgi:hypothetical protein